MNKDSEDKLTNAIIALNQEIKKQGENTQKELAKINLSLAEMRLSYMKLDESFNRYASSNDKIVSSHENRIERLEGKTFGSPYLVKEPVAKYRKSKKK